MSVQHESGMFQRVETAAFSTCKGHLWLWDQNICRYPRGKKQHQKEDITSREGLQEVLTVTFSNPRIKLLFKYELIFPKLKSFETKNQTFDQELFIKHLPYAKFQADMWKTSVVFVCPLSLLWGENSSSHIFTGHGEVVR